MKENNEENDCCFQAVVSLKRLGKFLCQDELKADAVLRAPYTLGEATSDYDIRSQHKLQICIVYSLYTPTFHLGNTERHFFLKMYTIFP